MCKIIGLIALIFSTCSQCNAFTSDAWFWHQAFRPAVTARIPEHLRLCAEAENAAANLPSRNSVVRQMLNEAADHLRRANVALLAEASKNSASKLHKILPSTSGQGLGTFESAVHTFTAEGAVSTDKKLAERFDTDEEVAQRLVHDLSQELEAKKKPSGLRGFTGAQENPTDVVGECRHVSKLGFDVLKFDIRHDGVPKTPAAAQSLAKSLIQAAGQTRHTWYQFMSHVDGLSSPWGAGAHFLPSTPSQPATVEDAHVAETIFST